PDNTFAYDGPDPYLFVAADKGTATFSDIANSLSADFGFWLGDSFASGGSIGYDHKKYGITARGTWESIYRHFADIGINVNEPFSVVGIGDMSGDVFGNGMLQHRTISLRAAFDHRHIFIDPEPKNLDASYDERKRLFELRGSSWRDYNSDLISEGGGVFDRNAKEIQITPQMREALSIPADAGDVMSGEDLIRHILRANVDLLYNGGIGTYVKANKEGHTAAKDPSNDRVRINSDELRCRVVGEGGNLGFTAAARNQASRTVRLNSDAIDNGAGVGLSNLEVIYKMALAPAVREERLTPEDRNTLILASDEFAVESVLSQSRRHSLLLTMAEAESPRKLGYFESLIDNLEKLKLIDRKLDNLPTREEFQLRRAEQRGLTRPELAKCMAVVKIWTKDILLGSDILDSEELKPFLHDYFPPQIRERFSSDLDTHPLRREIVATQLTNFLVDSLG
ncbi:MAG: NAD-glutamate dehydrogenase, partial [Bdellovibrionales bacterium]|nr:NAD-glutamate dehydrogenase [Bdellovibrionales bacterium]